MTDPYQGSPVWAGSELCQALPELLEDNREKKQKETLPLATVYGQKKLKRTLHAKENSTRGPRGRSRPPAGVAEIMPTETTRSKDPEELSKVP